GAPAMPPGGTMPGMEGPGTGTTAPPGEAPPGGTPPENGNNGDETPPKPTQPALVMIQPAAVETTKDGSFSIDVLIMQADNVGHVPFYLSYDPAVLAFQGAVEGDFLKSGGAQTSFQQANTPPGTLIFGCSRLGTSGGASGSGRIATITFKALKAGQSAL